MIDGRIGDGAAPSMIKATAVAPADGGCPRATAGAVGTPDGTPDGGEPGGASADGAGACEGPTGPPSATLSDSLSWMSLLSSGAEADLPQDPGFGCAADVPPSAAVGGCDNVHASSSVPARTPTPSAGRTAAATWGAFVADGVSAAALGLWLEAQVASAAPAPPPPPRRPAFPSPTDGAASAAAVDWNSAFHCVEPPGIGIAAYVDRVCQYGGASAASVVLASILLSRAAVACPESLSPSPLNAHRLLLTAVSVAAKLHDDTIVSAAHYGAVGGVCPAEMQLLELALLAAIEWRTFVAPREFDVRVAALTGTLTAGAATVAAAAAAAAPAAIVTPPVDTRQRPPLGAANDPPAAAAVPTPAVAAAAAVVAARRPPDGCVSRQASGGARGVGSNPAAVSALLRVVSTAASSSSSSSSTTASLLGGSGGGVLGAVGSGRRGSGGLRPVPVRRRSHPLLTALGLGG